MELELPSYLENMKMNGTNNFQSCDGLEIYLTAIGIEHHLTEEAPIGDQRKINVWKMEEAQIVNLMDKTMEPDMAIMCSCTSRKSCKEIWDYVRPIYSRDRTKLYELWVKFIRLKQGDRSVMKYCDAFYELMYEEQMMKQNELLLSFCFLAGLKPEFEPLVYKILRQAEMPSLNEIYHRVLWFESAFNECASSFGRNSSCNGEGHHRSIPSKCTHSGRQNHSRNQCWDLLGKPF